MLRTVIGGHCFTMQYKSSLQQIKSIVMKDCQLDRSFFLDCSFYFLNNASTSAIASQSASLQPDVSRRRQACINEGQLMTSTQKGRMTSFAVVKPWALALFKCGHHVQLQDKTWISALVMHIMQETEYTHKGVKVVGPVKPTGGCTDKQCVIKHRCWYPPRSSPLYSFTRRCVIRQEGLPFSHPGPVTAVHWNAHLNSNGGELHQLQAPHPSPLFFPWTYTLKIYSAADK